MKSLIIFFGLLAFAAASAIPSHHDNYKYQGPEHMPIIGQNGVPVDTEEVQKATADHLAYKAEAHARNAASTDFSDVETVDSTSHQTSAASHLTAVHQQIFGNQKTTVHHQVSTGHATPTHHQASTGYFGRISGSTDEHVPVIGPNGVPVDTPDVQQATAEHFAHKAYVSQAYTDDYQTDAYDGSGAAHTASKYHHASGAVHTAPKYHHASGMVHATPTYHQTQFGKISEAETQHIPVIGSNGVPVDTPAVQQATADHFSHKAYVAQTYTDAYHTDGSVSGSGSPTHHGFTSTSHVAPKYHQAYAAHNTPVHHQVSTTHFGKITEDGSHHVPVIDKNGVPVDTPAVQKATADHLAYKSEVYARNAAVQHETGYQYGHHQKYTGKTSPVMYKVSTTYGAPAHHQGSTFTAPAHYQYGQSAHHDGFSTHTGATQFGHVQHHSFTAGHTANKGEAYKTTHEVPQVSADGTPLDTQEVVAAKNFHYAAHKAALTGGVYAADYTVPCVHGQ